MKKINLLINKQMSLPKEANIIALSVLLFDQQIRQAIATEDPLIAEVYLKQSEGQDFIFVYKGDSIKYPYTRITVEYI